MKHVVCRIAQFFILLDSARDRDQKEQNPGNANFCKHFEIDRAESGVEGDAHKVVVDDIPTQSNGLASPMCCSTENVNEDGTCERGDYSDSHELPKVFNDPWQSKNSSLVQTES